MNQARALAHLLRNKELGLDLDIVLVGIQSCSMSLDDKLSDTQSSSIQTDAKYQPSKQKREAENVNMMNSNFATHPLSARIVFGLLLHSIRLAWSDTESVIHQDLAAKVTDLSQTMAQLARSFSTTSRTGTQLKDRMFATTMSISPFMAGEEPNRIEDVNRNLHENDRKWFMYLDRVKLFANSLVVEDEEFSRTEETEAGHTADVDATKAHAERAAAVRVVLKMIDAVKYFGGQFDKRSRTTHADALEHREAAANAIEDALSKLVVLHAPAQHDKI
jgi:hypothetical protein